MGILVLYLCINVNIDIQVPWHVIQRSSEVCHNKYQGCVTRIEDTGNNNYRVRCKRGIK